MAKRQLRLGAFMRPVSIHTGAWRYPGAWPDANFNFDHLRRLIRKLEAGKFDAFFMADHLAVLNMPISALKRSHTVTSFEPFTLLSALAGATEHIGLIATGSTTFDEPYHVARRFASLDHISGGRAGWNIVTTSNPDAARNFGLEDHMEHAERYRRAREFYDVVTGLWDSFADDAFARDVETGLFFDPAKMHVLDHEGKYLKVRGPLNIARPIQGWPVIVQRTASSSPPRPRRRFSPVAAASVTVRNFTPISRAAWIGSAATAITSRCCQAPLWWLGTVWKRRKKSALCSTAWCIMTAQLPRSR
jgi:alkanesulfonate monooxygenase